jgi:hypothetical protein
MPNLNIQQYIEDRVKVDPDSGCWVWSKAKAASGYGVAKVGGKTAYAHRLSFRAFKGEPGEQICHTCDNRECVNPDHLFSGTNADNVADMLAKGRNQRGSTHWNAKLADEDVLEIYASQHLQADLAAQFGISQATVSAIKNGKAWEHVTEISRQA